MASDLRLFLLLLLLTVSTAFSTNPEGEALHALRSRIKDPKNVLQSWDPTLVNPCTWFHVTCDDHNRVIRLDLGNSNISGPLGPELGRLEHLQYLYFSFCRHLSFVLVENLMIDGFVLIRELYRNNFEGKIPKELGNLKNLISMDLYGNRLEGEIPKSLGNLKSLRFLRLNNNHLTGSIPRELASLSNLRVFDVSNNDLCGTIPIDGPFPTFPYQSYENNNRLTGPELQGLVSYDNGC
ncbi:leucine-rich repeat protein 2-like isoform X1 [Wolffia australiana]